MEVEFLSFDVLQDIIQDDSIVVKRVIHNIMSDGGFYVFYETKQETSAQENDRMLGLINTAKEVSTEEDYLTLKNNRQREIYLLTFYDLTTVDAKDVIELLKPEMSVLFKEETP